LDGMPFASYLDLTLHETYTLHDALTDIIEVTRPQDGDAGIPPMRPSKARKMI